MHAFTWFLILYTGSALIGVATLWFFYDRSEKKRFEMSRRQRVFHCVRCGSLYEARKENVEEGEPCPKCSYKNYELSY